MLTTIGKEEAALFDEIGKKFWLKLFLGIVVVGIALFIFLMFVMKTIYAVGIFAGFLLMFAILGGAIWIWDRRNERSQADGPSF